MMKLTASGATAPVVPAKASMVMAVVSAGVIAANVDLFVVNVAFPAMAEDFGRTDLGALSWVLNAYAIVFAAALIPAGRFADRTSRKGGFLWGLALFTASSAACALAPGVGVLVAARVVQALGAALLVPTSLGLLLAAYPPERRAGAVRTWAGLGGVAAAVGPVVGGLLVEADWRWVFLINLPLGVVAFAMGMRHLPDDRPAAAQPIPDLLGAGLLVVAVGAVALALVKGPDWGWSSSDVLLAAAAALVGTVGVVVRSATHRSPVVEPALLQSPAYVAATTAALVFSVAFAAMLLSSVLWAQTQWGWSALKTGLAVAPGPAMVPLLAKLAGPLIGRWGAGRVAALGSLVFAAGTGWWAVAIDHSGNYAGAFLPGMLATGIGVGLVIPTLMAAAATTLPPERFATGSAVVNMARQIGSVLGIAALVAVLGEQDSLDGWLDSFRNGWWMVSAVAVGSAVASARIGRQGAAR